MYSTWRVVQLKEELKKRGASQQGKKSELVDRLEAYDRNFNFQNVCFDSPESQMELPGRELFRDVNSNTLLPPMTKEHIHLYFLRFNKKTEDGHRLYESRYLLVLRCCRVGNETYIKGVCKASMKKIQYEVNLKILNDGSPEESSCECAVGSGKEAHCKHVAVVMFAVEQMFREKQILLHEVCTQKLQSFHKPKIFTASPIKVEKMPSKRQLSNIIFHPYPLQNINKKNYNDRIRNICIGASNSSMPMKQRYGPANPYAYINDHTYEDKDLTEKLLDQFLLTDISEDQITNIEKKTRGQVKNLEWHNQRKNRITASNFHTVCHLTPRRQSAFADQLMCPHTFSSRATSHGIINENIAVKQYMQTFKLNVRNCGLFISKEHPFLAASPDGLLGEETIIEVKCPYACRYQEINNVTVPYLYIDNNVLKLKKTCIYYYQIQGQLYCANKKYCNLIIYTFKDMKVIYLTRDEEFLIYMLVKLSAFYNSFFKPALFQKYIYKNYK